MIQFIKKRVEAGELFSKTLETFPHTFSDLMVNQIRVGERSGAMVESLSRLATQVEHANSLRSQIIKKLSYPLILMGAGLVCVTFMLVFVIPVFEETYATSGIPLPMITEVLIASGQFTIDYGWLAPLVGVAAFYGLKQYRKDPRHAQRLDRQLIKLPIFGSWLRDIAVLQFMNALGDLLESGFHVVEALRLSAQSVGNRAVRHAVEHLHAAVTRGERLSHEMELQEELFPPVVSELVIIGEKTGNMVHSTTYIRGHLQREIDRKTNILVGTHRANSNGFFSDCDRFNIAGNLLANVRFDWSHGALTMKRLLRKYKSDATSGFSMMELIAVISILGILSVLAIHRITSSAAEVNKNNCHVIRGNIEVQAELYYRNNAVWPTTAILSANNEYFPEGIPDCPVDGTAYLLDGTTHRVIGHDH